MAFPSGKVQSSTPVKSDFLRPDDFVRVGDSVLTDYEYGGAAIQDPSAGFFYQIWHLWVEGDQVKLAPQDNLAAAHVLFSAPNIREITFTFDSNMNPVVAYIQAGQSKLYWYDLTQTPPGFVTQTITGANGSPFLTFDDKRERMIGQADVMLFYIVDQAVKVRLMRDRFTVEYEWGTLPKGAERIASAGMSEGNRLQLAFSFPSGPPSFLWNLEDPAVGYTRLDFGDVLGANASTSSVTDRLYLTTDEGFAEFAGGIDPMEYEWQSGDRVFRPPVSFSAGTVDAYGDCTIEVFADGVLRTAVDVHGRSWFRIPPGRPARRWSIKATGTARIRKIELGTSFEELRAV